MGLQNPPVTQIFLIGPKEEGLHLAREMFPVCVKRNWVPAIFVSEYLTEETERQIVCPTQRSGVIAFGRGSAQVYETLCRRENPVKVIRLLEQGEPEPDHIFSYQNQVREYPEEISRIVSWMGIVSWMKDTYFCFGKPGALTVEELYPQTVPK